MDVALVLAGNSFVGRHLCRRLGALGIPCESTARRPRGSQRLCDLTTPAHIDAVLRDIRPRWVFACAGLTGPSSASDLHALHVVATEHLLNAVARHVPGAVTVLFG